MVVGVFPTLKLGVLFVKHISKPLAQVLVNQAKKNHVFRTYFIMPPAQLYHWAEVTAKMYLMNLGKPAKVAKLNEAMAIELGANLMGEVIIFSIAGACVLYEYQRQVIKETKKEDARLAQLQKFTDDIEYLSQATINQEKQIQYLRNALEELAKYTKHKLPPMDHITQSDSTSNSSDVREGGNKSNDDTLKSNTETNEKNSKSIIKRALVNFKTDVKALERSN